MVINYSLKCSTNVMTKRHILVAVSVQNEPRLRSVPDKTPPDTTPVFHLPPFVVAANKNGIIFGSYCSLRI